MKINWKDALRKIAPLAGTMIGGPFAPLAATAIGAVFGHDEASGAPDERQMEKYMASATPDQLIALKKIDADLETKNKELGIREEELIYDDKKDARITHKDSIMPAVLVIVLTVGLLAFVAALFTVEIPNDNKAMIYSIFGSWITCWMGALQYYFGTTKSSGDKTKLMSSK